MTFRFKEFKKALEDKYVQKLTAQEIDELLTFEDGIIKDKFPQKRITIKRVFFKGKKEIRNEAIEFVFDKTFTAGIWMILADNLRGKSSLFKIIKYALTGDYSELAVDIRGWLQVIYVEFTINEVAYTVLIDRTQGLQIGVLYKKRINEIIDTSIEISDIIFKADNASIFKNNIQSFFFKELEFYHLIWTQKSSQKTSNQLHDAHATWSTYFESIYLTSRSSDKLAFGNQEELIFQMLLGLSLTFPINRIKARLDKVKFELAKLKDFDSSEARQRQVELKQIFRDLDKVKKELDDLYKLEGPPEQVSTLVQLRAELTTKANDFISKQQFNEQEILIKKRSIQQWQSSNTDITSRASDYKELLTKIKRQKLALEEHVNFGIFFSNLEIKICPHCNTPVSDQKKKDEIHPKTCQLCSHSVGDEINVDKNHYQHKIDSLTAEINGYENQLEILRTQYKINREQVNLQRSVINEHEESLKYARSNYRASLEELKSVEEQLRKAKRKEESEKKEIELLNNKAVLEYRLAKAAGLTANATSDEIVKSTIKEELLTDALEQLKESRKTQNEDILKKFKDLLLEELQELGISNVSEVRLSESFKISYLINSNWVGFDEISEGEQLRVKIAFYLSIIQLDTTHKAGKHPRLLIIDSPVKEEGDQNYIDGLKKLLSSISEKYKEDLQIIIGTASRQLTNSVPGENAYIYNEKEYLF